MKYFVFVSTVILLLEVSGGRPRRPQTRLVSLLVMSDTGTIDAQYAQELTKSGYRVETVAFTRQSVPILPKHSVPSSCEPVARMPAKQYSVEGENTVVLQLQFVTPPCLYCGGRRGDPISRQ